MLIVVSCIEEVILLLICYNLQLFVLFSCCYSINDNSVDPELRGGYLAFTLEVLLLDEV